MNIKEYRKKNKFTSIEIITGKYPSPFSFESKMSVISIIEEDINKDNIWSFTVKSVLSSIICLVCIFLIETINLSFVGYTSDSELNLTIVGMGNTIMHLSSLFFVFGSIGALDTFGSFAFGQKNFTLLNLYTIRMRVFIYGCFILLTLPFCLFSGQLLSLLGVSTEITDGISLYTRYMIPTIFITFNLHINVRYLQVIQDYTVISIITAISIVAHYIMNYIMFNYYNSEFYVITYVSLITVSFAFISSTIYIHLFIKEDRRMVFFLPNVFDNDIILFIQLGFYSAIQEVGNNIGFEIIGLIGCLIPPNESNAASLVVLNYTTIVGYLYSGSSYPLSHLIGFCLGKENKGLYYFIIRAFVKVNLLISILLSGFTFFNKQNILSIYTDNSTVLQYADPIITLYSFFILADTFNFMFQGVLKGTGNQHISSVWNIILAICVTIPFGCLLAFVLGFKVLGLWIGEFALMSIMLIVTFIYSYKLDFSKEAEKLHSELNSIYSDETEELLDKNDSSI